MYGLMVIFSFFTETISSHLESLRRKHTYAREARCIQLGGEIRLVITFVQFLVIENKFMLVAAKHPGSAIDITS